jgi:hypothetical protein
MIFPAVRYFNPFLTAIIQLPANCSAVHPAGVTSQPIMAKQKPAKPKGPGRPYKGKLKTTLRLSRRVVDALEQARATTGRPKSDIAEEAISAYLHLPSKQGE